MKLFTSCALPVFFLFASCSMPQVRNDGGSLADSYLSESSGPRLSATLTGKLSASYVDSVPGGGIVQFGSRATKVDENGRFTLPFIEPEQGELDVVYNGVLVASETINVTEGINRYDFTFDKIFPAFMEKHLAPEAADSDIFRPVSPSVYTIGNPALKRVAITLDDGWVRDEKTIDLFRQYNIQATVFIIGGRNIAEKRPDWIKEMDDLGFEVCTHTYSHYFLSFFTDKDVEKQIRNGQKIITNVTHKKFPYLRPPMGAYDSRVLRIAAQNGYKIILWSNAILDYIKGIKPEKQIASVMGKLRNGDIILAHFGAYNTYEVLKALIPQILARGYEIGTVSSVLEGLR
jgi:peptidoglycan-N-acetylglucosamine deacetylase